MKIPTPSFVLQQPKASTVNAPKTDVPLIKFTQGKYNQGKQNIIQQISQIPNNAYQGVINPSLRMMGMDTPKGFVDAFTGGAVSGAQESMKRQSEDRAKTMSEALDPVKTIKGFGRDIVEPAVKPATKIVLQYKVLPYLLNSLFNKVQPNTQQHPVTADVYRGEGKNNPFSGYDAYGPGKYYTTDKNLASQFGEPKQYKVSFQNPLVINDQNDLSNVTTQMIQNGHNSITEYAKSLGKDGIIDNAVGTYISIPKS